MCIAMGDQTVLLSDTAAFEVSTITIALQDREGSGAKVKGVSGEITSVSSIADFV